ncbi:MAG: FecR domain-containing protein [Elusimicrobia bacterium]|nr:FecR domain-containing protein [Elusimicrobiota bacterium]
MKLIACVALLALSAPALAASAAVPPAAARTATALAALAVTMGPVSGSAQLQQVGSDVWFFARPGRRLAAGTTVKTEAGSDCVLLLSGGTKLRLKPQSHLRVAELSPERATMSLGAGRLEAWARMSAGAEFRIVTPMFTATLPEGILAAEILSETSATLDIFTGEPTVIDSLGKSRKVSAGQRMELGAMTGASTPAPLPAGAVRPEEPSLAGPAKPGAAPRKVKAAEPPPAAKSEAAPRKVKAAEPPPPAKSSYPGSDSQL